MIDVRFQPIKEWPGSTKTPVDSRFGKWEAGRGQDVGGNDTQMALLIAARDRGLNEIK